MKDKSLAAAKQPANRTKHTPVIQLEGLPFEAQKRDRLPRQTGIDCDSSFVDI
jgi:hypothetical protein